MTIEKRLKQFLAVALAIGLSPVVADAQQQDQAGSNGAQSRTETMVTQGHGEPFARLFATELALANRYEIRLAQLASEQTKDPQVEQYAQTLIRDHQQLNRELVRLFPEIENIEGMKAAVQPGTGGSDQLSDTRQLDGATARQVVKTSAAGERQSNNVTLEMIRICTDASNIKYDMSKEMLEQYQGSDFDMAFMGQQIAGHLALVAQLEAINKSKVETENLEPILVKAEVAARQHMELAQQLCKQLKRGNGNR